MERIPRPRNAFMIFRSEFWAAEKINAIVEHDHRHISRIIGHCWNQMPQDEKLIWFLKAEEEKAAHMRKYPHYRFTPSSRVKKPVKRNVKRNGEDEMRRCRLVADLLLAGKEGDDLSTAVNETVPQSHFKPGPNALQVAPMTYLMNPSPFHSPLLPPAYLPESTTSTTASVPHTEYYSLSRHGDIMSDAMLLTSAQPPIEGDVQTSVPSFQYSLEQSYDPAPPKTHISTYAYSSTPPTHTHHYDKASHFYSSAYAQSYPRHCEAESSVQRDVSNASMHARIRFNNPFDPHTAFPLQFNPPPSSVDPLHLDFPVGY